MQVPAGMSPALRRVGLLSTVLQGCAVTVISAARLEPGWRSPVKEDRSDKPGYSKQLGNPLLHEAIASELDAPLPEVAFSDSRHDLAGSAEPARRGFAAAGEERSEFHQEQLSSELGTEGTGNDDVRHVTDAAVAISKEERSSTPLDLAQLDGPFNPRVATSIFAERSAGAAPVSVERSTNVAPTDGSPQSAGPAGASTLGSEVRASKARPLVPPASARAPPVLVAEEVAPIGSSRQEATSAVGIDTSLVARGRAWGTSFSEVVASRSGYIIKDQMVSKVQARHLATIGLLGFAIAASLFCCGLRAQDGTVSEEEGEDGIFSVVNILSDRSTMHFTATMLPNRGRPRGSAASRVTQQDSGHSGLDPLDEVDESMLQSCSHSMTDKQTDSDSGVG